MTAGGGARLGRAHVDQEPVQLELEAVAVLRQRLRRRQHLGGRRPVSVAPRWTSVTLDETCCVPCAACWTLREISCVAAPCSSTAAAMAEEISDSLLDRA